jgi:hypothetical protein
VIMSVEAFKTDVIAFIGGVITCFTSDWPIYWHNPRYELTQHFCGSRMQGFYIGRVGIGLRLGLWCLTPLSTIFQLYHDSLGLEYTCVNIVITF